MPRWYAPGSGPRASGSSYETETDSSSSHSDTIRRGHARRLLARRGVNYTARDVTRRQRAAARAYSAARTLRERDVLAPLPTQPGTQASGQARRRTNQEDADWAFNRLDMADDERQDLRRRIRRIPPYLRETFVTVPRSVPGDGFDFLMGVGLEGHTDRLDVFETRRLGMAGLFTDEAHVGGFGGQENTLEGIDDIYIPVQENRFMLRPDEIDYSTVRLVEAKEDNERETKEDGNEQETKDDGDDGGGDKMRDMAMYPGVARMQNYIPSDDSNHIGPKDDGGPVRGLRV